MSLEMTSHRPRPDWLPRSIISGFIATVIMAILFFIAYGLARIATTVQLNSTPSASEFTQWLHALTNNQVLNLATSSLYLAAALHLLVGVVWAMVYGYWVEPRVEGADWLKGMSFAVVPWLLSLIVFLPLVGGGLFGFAIGAGPLPAIGNLILHLAYGATLGEVYGPLGDIPADDLSREAPVDDVEVMTHYERAAARGIVVGTAIGAIVGVAAALFLGANPGASATAGASGTPSAVMVPVGMVVGAILGGLWGSIAGLAGAPGHAAAR